MMMSQEEISARVSGNQKFTPDSLHFLRTFGAIARAAHPIAPARFLNACTVGLAVAVGAVAVAVVLAARRKW